MNELWQEVTTQGEWKSCINPKNKNKVTDSPQISIRGNILEMEKQKKIILECHEKCIYSNRLPLEKHLPVAL